MKNDNVGPAFPVALNPGEGFNKDCMGPADGMTLRDYFAAKAIPIVAQRFNFSRGDLSGEYIAVESFESIAFDAYLLADAMLQERAK
jgi:hypothetical protein